MQLGQDVPLASIRSACFAVTMRGTLAMVLAITPVVAGCGEATRSAAENARSSQQPPSTASSPSAPTGSPEVMVKSPKRAGRELKVAGSAYGPMLFDRSGQAIYLFARERARTPKCYGACADAWPPVLTTGPPQGSGAIREQLLGTTRRKDGSQQVTYDGHPLYFYAHEGKNEVLCHNVSEFGGLWLVVTPSGEPAA
jgi:predicted lipoprotein with Yx(FWY)xxD motif